MRKLFRHYVGSVYFSRRCFFILALIAVWMVVSYAFPILLAPAKFFLGLTGLLALLDYLVLFNRKTAPVLVRNLPERFSNGDPNTVSWTVRNAASFPLNLSFLEEWPVQLVHLRKWEQFHVLPGEEHTILAQVRPVERGIYSFPPVILLLRSPLKLIVRKIKAGDIQEVRTYPSYLEVRRYSLMAFSDPRSETGHRALRRIGHSMEFEQIKEYVLGDDVRAVNWKATARRSQLMVNHYIDEKSQQVCCLIDKSRVMKMSFRGLTLLDYAINASLMLLRVALLRQDRAGLICFSSTVDTILPAERTASQMNRIVETLYRQQTGFLEADMDALYSTVQRTVPQRSLLVLFTNFESHASLTRQLPYLKRMASRHLLLVVFFENTELIALSAADADDMETIYRQTIARQFMMEKRLMVKELQQHGILSVLCPPESVTVQTINKYLELKSRMLI